MNIETRMETFNYAYIYALAAQSGFSFQEEPRPIDHQGIDISIKDPNRLYQLPPCAFSAQVKCTKESSLKRRNDKVFYPLRRKNYDTLIKSKPGNTILLIVMVVPDRVEDWITIVNPSTIVGCSTVVRYGCHWLYLQDHPESRLKHEDSKELIELKEENLLTPETFPIVMQSIADGEM